MNTFFKTFFVCLVVTLAFLSYKLFSQDSYQKNLITTNNSPYTTQKEDIKEEIPVEGDEIPVVKETSAPVKPEKKVVESYIHKCYFFDRNGNLTLIQRELGAKPTLESEILLLLKGPLLNESKIGIYSEIPMNTDLISINKVGNDLTVNLSSNFGNGGGTKSVENRILQLSKTIKLIEPKKNIYLQINGVQVDYLGGDGVYIKQPL